MSEQGLIAKGRIFNTSVATGTDFFGTDLVPTYARSTFRVTVNMQDVASKLIVQETDSTPVTVPGTLNNDTDIPLGGKETFTFGVDSNYTYNFQHSDAGAVTVSILVEEVLGGVI